MHKAKSISVAMTKICPLCNTGKFEVKENHPTDEKKAVKVFSCGTKMAVWYDEKKWRYEIMTSCLADGKASPS